MPSSRPSSARVRADAAGQGLDDHRRGADPARRGPGPSLRYMVPFSWCTRGAVTAGSQPMSSAATKCQVGRRTWVRRNSPWSNAARTSAYGARRRAGPATRGHGRTPGTEPPASVDDRRRAVAARPSSRWVASRRCSTSVAGTTWITIPAHLRPPVLLRRQPAPRIGRVLVAAAQVLHLAPRGTGEPDERDPAAVGVADLLAELVRRRGHLAGDAPAAEQLGDRDRLGAGSPPTPPRPAPPSAPAGTP